MNAKTATQEFKEDKISRKHNSTKGTQYILFQSGIETMGNHIGKSKSQLLPTSKKKKKRTTLKWILDSNVKTKVVKFYKKL